MFKEDVDVFGMPLYEMSNLRPNETGLPMVVWVNPNTGRERHGPRIKVQTQHGNKVSPDKMTAVGFSRDGSVTNFGGLSDKDFDLVKTFINKNIDILLKLWDDEISPAEFIRDMKSIS